MGDKEHFLSNEYCYIDGKWNRCKDFPTVTLSVHHPVLRKQVPLFIMECEGETAECYTKFFSLVNEAIEKIIPGKVFDPVAGFMADEAGGLQEGLRKVHGNSVLEKLKTCEFHFLQCANRQRARLHSKKSKKFFTRVTRTLLQAQTSSSYNDAIQELKEFVAKKPAKDQRGFLIPWLEWWDDRRSHVFPAFARKNAPATNLVEVIHSKWKTTGGTHLSLVDAAAEDIKDSLILVSSACDWLGYGPYTVSIGTTPSCTCEDFMKSRMVKICKHLIWVYVVILGVNEKDDTLQQAALTEQEVRSTFQRAPPPCTRPNPALDKKR